jgi:hypothetical protein
MPWNASILVIANRTADSEELLVALDRRAKLRPTTFMLVLPALSCSAGARVAATERLRDALKRARQRGLQIDGTVGDSDPIVAVAEAFHPGRYDEIVVCTLPLGTSRWLMIDLPHRIGRLTGVLVDHVLALAPEPNAPMSSSKRLRPGTRAGSRGPTQLPTRHPVRAGLDPRRHRNTGRFD